MRLHVRYGLQGAGLTRFRVLNAMRNSRELKEILEKSDLEVVSLGSGPGNDVIGLCSAFSQLNLDSLRITAVDKFAQFGSFLKLSNVLLKNEYENFGNVSALFRKTNVDLSFLEVDLPGGLEADKEYFDALARADIILLAKLLGILEFRSINNIMEVSLLCFIMNKLYYCGFFLIENKQIIYAKIMQSILT